jgi:hypothetical protein
MFGNPVAAVALVNAPSQLRMHFLERSWWKMWGIGSSLNMAWSVGAGQNGFHCSEIGQIYFEDLPSGYDIHSSPWKITMLVGKPRCSPSISIRAMVSMARLNNQRVTQWGLPHGLLETPFRDDVAKKRFLQLQWISQRFPGNVPMIFQFKPSLKQDVAPQL